MGASAWLKERPMVTMIVTIGSAWALAFATMSSQSSKDELDSKATTEYVDDEITEVRQHVDLRINSIKINTQQEFNNIKKSQEATQAFLEKQMGYLREDLKFIRENMD